MVSSIFMEIAIESIGLQGSTTETRTFASSTSKRGVTDFFSSRSPSVRPSGSLDSRHRREVARTMDEVDDLNLAGADAIDEAIASNEQLADVGIVLFGHDATTIGELPERTCRFSSFSHERCRVPR